MKQFERKVYSQGGQDGVLEHIFEVIGTTNKCFVEFGAGDGEYLSNTANLRLNHGWKGLLMDTDNGLDVVKALVTPDNIEDLLHKFCIPRDFDYLSIDVDGNDYWIWKAIRNWSPRVVSIEVNTHFPYDMACVIQYNPDHVWDGTSYFGASLAALYKLGNKKGYRLVHLVDTLDAFFVREDLMNDIKSKHPRDLLPESIYCFPNGKHRPWVNV